MPSCSSGRAVPVNKQPRAHAHTHTLTPAHVLKSSTKISSLAEERRRPSIYADVDTRLSNVAKRQAQSHPPTHWPWHAGLAPTRIRVATKALANAKLSVVPSRHLCRLTKFQLFDTALFPTTLWQALRATSANGIIARSKAIGELLFAVPCCGGGNCRAHFLVMTTRCLALVQI